jgi:hypothetical protein
MTDYIPSTDFVARTMEDIRAYERGLSSEREHINRLLRSKPMVILLYAGGILFGILAVAGMASTLIFPTTCL